jgi:hypothetical protein
MCRDDGCLTTLDNHFLYRDVGHIRRNLPMSTRKALAEIIGMDRITELSAIADSGISVTTRTD